MSQITLGFAVRLAVLGAVVVGVGCASAPRAGSSAAPDVMAVGVAAIDITPEDPIRLTGYGNRATSSEGVNGRLWAKALAFGGDREPPAVLVTADLIGVSRAMSDELARRLRSAGVDRAHLAVAATHTHTGPSLSGVLPFIFSTPVTSDEQAVIDRYTRQLVDKLERVAREALTSRQPSRVAWGSGTAGFAANRRVLKDGKWVTFGVQSDGPVDRELPVMTIRGADGTLRAVLVNYACHATTLEAKQNFVHGDWPGVAQELIQKRHPGAVVMVSIGTGADANPNPRGGGIPDVERHATEIANEVDRLLKSTLRPLTTPPAARFRYLDLGFAATPTREQWKEQATRKGADGLFARAMLERLTRGDDIPRSVPYPIQAWTFGQGLTMIFLGGEVVADYGLRLKRELGAETWVTAYANDVAFYVASQRMIPEGGYEVDRSMVYYGQPARLADSTENAIVASVKSLIPSP